MHDPAAIFRFEEHDIYLPMVVLEELDANKKGLSEAARNVRQVSRFLDDMMRGVDQGADRRRPADPVGAAPATTARRPPSGRLFFQTRDLAAACPQRCPAWRADNVILGQTLALQKRAAARARGAGVQGHQPAHQGRDRRRARRGLLQRPHHRGRRPAVHRHRARCRRISGSSTASDMRSWKEGDRTWYELHGPGGRATGTSTSSCTRTAPQGIEAMVRKLDGDTATLELVRDYRSERHSVWGITARNREQNFALNLLMDPDIDCVTHPRARPAPARRCWRWPPAWCRRWSATASPRSS